MTTVLVVKAYVAGIFICVLIERQMRAQYREEMAIRHQTEVIDDEGRRADAHVAVGRIPRPRAAHSTR